MDTQSIEKGQDRHRVHSSPQQQSSLGFFFFEDEVGREEFRLHFLYIYFKK